MSLGLAVSLLCYSQSRACPNRHAEAARGWSFLADYTCARLAHSEVEVAGGGGLAGSLVHSDDASAVSTGSSSTTWADSSRAAAAASSSSSFDQSDGRAGLGSGAGPDTRLPISQQPRGSLAGRLGVDADSWLPRELPRYLLEREVWYNIGRAAHQFALYGTAMFCYEQCLAVPAPGAIASSSSSVGAAAAATAGNAASYSNYASWMRGSASSSSGGTASSSPDVAASGSSAAIGPGLAVSAVFAASAAGAAPAESSHPARAADVNDHHAHTTRRSPHARELTPLMLEALNIQRDAAYNLVLIHAGTGDTVRAMEVTLEYLSYDDE